MVEGKVFHVQAETAIITDLEELIDVLNPCRLAVRGHTHHFVFTLIYLEAQKCSESRIQESKGVRELHFSKQIDTVLSFAIPIGGCLSYRRGGPFPDTINGQNSRLVVGRTENGAGRVAQMVLYKK